MTDVQRSGLEYNSARSRQFSRALSTAGFAHVTQGPRQCRSRGLRYRLEHAQDLRTHWENPRDVGTDLSIPVSSAEDGKQDAGRLIRARIA